MNESVLKNINEIAHQIIQQSSQASKQSIQDKLSLINVQWSNALKDTDTVTIR